MIQEFYYLREHWIDTSKNESVKAFDILVIQKDEKGIIHKSITLEKINGNVLKNLLGEDYQTKIII